ncbi:MAG: ATP-dependent Clp protease ATP-binding subunit [Deltaproteobacteria bacterium]|nr:ATP-dependent Clp protease ATP-binding subunit [Deltaproteobacteria bacterium]
MERARHLAEEAEERLDTGHVLLALIRGKGTAASLLRLRGLTEPKMREALRGRDAEPKECLHKVEAKADEVAASFGARRASALHVLAAVATVKRCVASQVLEDAGLKTDTIRNQALRCLTGVTEEHSARDDDSPPRIETRAEALPLSQHLRSLTATKPPPRETERPRSDAEPRPKRPRAPRSHTPRQVGRTLEQVQQKTRAIRRTPGTTHGNDVPLSAEAAEFEPATCVAPEPSPRAEEARMAPASEFELAPDRFPTLASLGRNLTQEAALGRLDGIVGREREMERMADVLGKRRGNSPCLVGPPGVGKTAIVEGFARSLASDSMPGLARLVVVEVRPGDLVAGTNLRGALAERLAALRHEVAASGGRVALFLDELHSLLGSGDAAEAVCELKAAMSRGELPCIAATTEEEYVKHVEGDPALARCFTRIDVAEPTEEEALRIVRGVQAAYEEHHRVAYGDGALEAAVRLSARYMPDRALPDKAIAVMDLAGARVRRAGAAEVRALDVASVLAEGLGVPVERLAANDKERLLGLEGELAHRVVGHSHVLSAIGETLRRNAAGFRSGRPIGSFLFLGPTGVGKTETAKAIADLLFPGSDSMVRLDMSEFSESHAVARLIGAPPGYVGHDEGGQLTEAVRRRPYSLVLLDEVEKAHRDVIQVLLQVLDDGRLTDGRGRTVVFENTVIVMTSNLGSNAGPRRRRMGFGADEDAEAGAAEVRELADAVVAAARAALPVELWNRIDEPLVFAPLSRSEVAAIARMLLGRVASQLAREQGIALETEESAVAALVEAGGFDAELGARPMRRTIQRLVEGQVARLVLTGEASRGDTVRVKGSGAQLAFAIDKAS